VEDRDECEGAPQRDFYFVQVDDPATAISRIIELAKTRIPKRFGLNQESLSRSSSFARATNSGEQIKQFDDVK